MSSPQPTTAADGVEDAPAPPAGASSPTSLTRDIRDLADDVSALRTAVLAFRDRMRGQA